MSRLEQMRQNFLLRVYSEQQHSLPLSKPALSWAKSMHNIPSLVKISQLQSQLRRTTSGLHSTYNIKYGPSYATIQQSAHNIIQTNISRVKSLNNINLATPNGVKLKCISSKQNEQFPKRNSTPSVNTHGTNANSAKVNRPTRPAIGSGTLPAEHKRSMVNSNSRNELQCLHCNRKFAAQERLDKHVEICAKTLNKQRTVFNSSKQRLKEHPSTEQNGNSFSGSNFNSYVSFSDRR